MKNLLINVFFVTASISVMSVPISAEPLQITITSGSSTDSMTTAVPASTIVLDQELIEQKSPDSLGELLSGVAGIQISNNGGGEVVSLRGISSENSASNVMILVDGRRLNNNDISRPDLNSVFIGSIERVEIFQGSAAVLYGDQAVGGVINIITKDNYFAGADGLEGSVNLSIGSYNKRALQASVTEKFSQNLWFSGDFDFLDTDNYRDHTAAEKSSSQLRMDYQKNDSLFYVELERVNDNFERSGGLTLAELEQDRTQVLSNFTNDFSNTETDIARIGVEAKLSEQWLYKVDAFTREAEQVSISSGRTFTGSQSETERSHGGLNPRLSGKYKLGAGDLSILLGADYNVSDIVFGWGRENQQTTRDIFFQTTVPLTRKFDVVFGSRKSKVQDELIDPSLYPSGTEFKNSTTASELGLAFSPNKNMRYYLRVAESYRLAKVDEQAYTSPGVLGLDPQTGLSKEMGADLNIDKSTISVNIYELALEDEIIYDSTAPTPVGGFFAGANVNADKSLRKGVSLAYNYAQPAYQLGFNVNSVDAKFDSGANSGNDIPFVADITTGVFFNYSGIKNTNIRLDSTYVGDRFAVSDNANSGEKVDSYSVFNLTTIYRLNNRSYQFKVNNLFDEEYESYVVEGSDRVYTPAPTRNFTFKASYQF